MVVVVELVDGSGPVGWAGPHMHQWLKYAAEHKFSRLPILEQAAELLPVLEAAAGALDEERTHRPAFCHFDLLPDNFVVGGDAGSPTVTLVDFEYAAGGQPLMDLAVFSMGCGLSADEDATLLSAYLELPAQPSAPLAHSFRALKVLAALRETMWGVVAEISRASALSDAEAMAYTEMNYGKLGEYRTIFEAASA